MGYGDLRIARLELGLGMDWGCLVGWENVTGELFRWRWCMAVDMVVVVYYPGDIGGGGGKEEEAVFDPFLFLNLV